MPASANHSRSMAPSDAGGAWIAFLRSFRLGDRVFQFFCQTAALAFVALFLALVGALVWQSWPALNTIGVRFFTTTAWDPEPTRQQFGALTFIYGTLMTSAIAMVIAVPLGIGTA